MTTLRDKLPSGFMCEFGESKAAKFIDVEVVAEHGFFSGGDNIRWLGKQRHAYVWWELANGYGVAWNENPSKGYSFPVMKLKK